MPLLTFSVSLSPLPPTLQFSPLLREQISRPRRHQPLPIIAFSLVIVDITLAREQTIDMYNSAGGIGKEYIVASSTRPG